MCNTQLEQKQIYDRLCYLGYQSNGNGVQELHHRRWHVSHMGPVLRDPDRQAGGLCEAVQGIPDLLPQDQEEDRRDPRGEAVRLLREEHLRQV